MPAIIIVHGRRRVVNAKAPLAPLSGEAQGCDNTARLGAWEQTLGFTHLDDIQGA
jgi:hypothetical protein